MGRRVERDAGRSTATLCSTPHPALSLLSTRGERVLGQDALYDGSMHIGQSEVSALKSIGQPLVIDAEAAEHRSVEVVDVDRVADDVVAVVVGFAVGQARLDPAPG